jgi:hypothetical protein
MGVLFSDAKEKPSFFQHPQLRERTVSVAYATDRGIFSFHRVHPRIHNMAKIIFLYNNYYILKVAR